MNVEVLTYDDSIPGHEELWKAIRSAAQAMSSRSRPEVSLSSPVQFQSPFGPIRDLLAMSYARASLETKIDLSVT